MRKQWIWLSLLLITGCPKEQDTDVDNYTDTGVEDNDDETSNPCDGDTDEQTTDTTAEDGQERPQLSLNGTTVEASIVFTDPTEGTQFASAVGIVGDTSGNGCDDVLIGAQHAGTNEAGAAYFYEGSDALPSSRSTTEADTAFANGNDKDWAEFQCVGCRRHQWRWLR